MPLSGLDGERRIGAPGGTVIAAPDDLLDWGIYGLEASDPRARPFVLLRSQILATAEKMNARCLAVTSPGAGNGKSYIAANLATSISRVAEVCLVDLHLRRPVIGEWFETPEKGGMAGCLSGRHNLNEAHYRLEHERLSIFPAGTSHEDASALLSQGLLDTFVSQLRALPGEPICIIDCPPMLENDDMLLIARHVDAVILVAEEGKTTQREITESARMLKRTPILGTLLNNSIVPAGIPE